MRLFLNVAAMVLLIGPSYALAGNWWETIKMKGDLRYRHEMIDIEGKDARHRHRIRARIGITGEVSPYTKVGIQLATGSDDPVSTNQTLDNAFSTKQVGIDLAYFEAYHDATPGLTITGGKFKNPFFRPGSSQLIWDSDWNPEGGAATYKRDMDRFSIMLTGSGLWIYERSSGDDSYIGAGQAVGRFHFNEKKSSIAVGGGYFNYANTEGFEVFYNPMKSKGNSGSPVVDTSAVVDTLGNISIEYDTTSYKYATDFDCFELFVEATHTFDNISVTVMVDYVTNRAADSLRSGWLVGFKAGKMKKPGSWEARYTYRNLKKDAVVGIFTHSDFGGGGTDAKGHEIGGAVQLATNTAFKVTCFITEIGLQGDETENYKKLQVDLQLKF
ncbi:MAG: putative porin [candidate division Zixibacteria bacterium]|nr:putative porin [candidate division Zixibacteria bacterium]